MRYPARGVGSLWLRGCRDPDARLASPIDATRAQILQALDQPPNPTALLVRTGTNH